MIYIDTSVLAAYYCPEPLSDKAEDILLAAKAPAISQLTEVEFSSALSRKIREKSLAEDDATKILSLFTLHISQKKFVRLPVESKHYSVAATLISRFQTPLKTLDALHLAIAVTNYIPILTADVKLAASARALNIEATLVS